MRADVDESVRAAEDRAHEAVQQTARAEQRIADLRTDLRVAYETRASSAENQEAGDERRS